MLTDLQGSVRDIVDQDGAAVSRVMYDAFGNIVGGTGVLLTRYLYTGREPDTLTGLQYNRNRWYDPALGRWLSEDPIGLEGGNYNFYLYGGNNSVSLRDPSGLWGVLDWLFNIDNSNRENKIARNQRGDIIRRLSSDINSNLNSCQQNHKAGPSAQACMQGAAVAGVTVACRIASSGLLVYWSSR
jgi:RHS repeat-associated protein